MIRSKKNVKDTNANSLLSVIICGNENDIQKICIIYVVWRDDKKNGTSTGKPSIYFPMMLR